MKNETNTKVYEKVNDRTSEEFLNIAIQLGDSVQAQYYHLTALLTGFRQMFIIFTEDETLYNEESIIFLDCTSITKIDYSKMCYFSPSSSTQPLKLLNQPTEVKQFQIINKKEMLKQIQSYNDLLPTFLTTLLRKQVSQLILLIEQPDNKVAVQMIYPAQPVNITYEPSKQLWYQQSFQNQKTYVLTGPFIDYLSPKAQQQANLLSLTYSQKYPKKLIDEQFVDYQLTFHLTFTCESLKSLFSELNYLTTAEVAVTDMNKNLIYAPSYWETNYLNELANIYNFSKYSGLTLTSPINITNQISQVNRLFSDNDTMYDFQIVEIILPGIYASAQLSSFINQTYNSSSSALSSNTGTIIYLYGMQSEMLHIYTLISTIINHEETVIILLTMCSCINTIAIVFIFTYMVAVRISRPLRKLISIAAQMSSTASQKNVTPNILNELNEIQAQNQIADLISAFRSLVQTIDQRNNTQKSTAKSQTIQYPLNQYDPEFINKTKGETDINWGNVIEEVEDDYS